jgi:hypothetical protein
MSNELPSSSASLHTFLGDRAFENSVLIKGGLEVLGPITGAGLPSGGLDWSTAPATPTSPGTAGQMAYSPTHFYVCTALNTWKRVAWEAWVVGA